MSRILQKRDQSPRPAPYLHLHPQHSYSCSVWLCCSWSQGTFTSLSFNDVMLGALHFSFSPEMQTSFLHHHYYQNVILHFPLSKRKECTREIDLLVTCFSLSFFFFLKAVYLVFGMFPLVLNTRRDKTLSEISTVLGERVLVQGL